MTDSANKSTRCEHRRLFPGSGGYYIFCSDCGHAWTCQGHHDAGSKCQEAASVMLGPCQTTLAGQPGRWVWQEEAHGAR